MISKFAHCIATEIATAIHSRKEVEDNYVTRQT